MYFGLTQELDNSLHNPFPGQFEQARFSKNMDFGLTLELYNSSHCKERCNLYMCNFALRPTLIFLKEHTEAFELN